MFGATVRVVGTSNGSTTDFEGKFQFQTEAGVCQVEVKMLGYQTRLFSRIEVKKGETNLLDVFLSEQVLETKTVEIVADVEKNQESSLLRDQRNAGNISSGVSAELLTRTPDRNLSESFRRISGTSIREGKFAMVRGLSERYNMGQLNGVAIPSTESDRKAFNLELFPSHLLDRIVVSKTASADQPGDLAGGLIKIQTLDIPYSNSIQASLAAEHHSLTTGRSFSQLKTSGTDWLGFDNGLRQIPKGFPDTEFNQSNLNFQQASMQSLGFDHRSVPRTRTAGPNLSGQFSVGRRGKLLGKTAGLVASINYYQTRLRNQFFFSFPTFTPTNEIKESVSSEQDRFRTQASLSGVLNASVKPTVSTKISLRNFFSQTGTNLTQLTDWTLATTIDPVRTEFIDKRSIVSFFEQSRLYSGQLSAEKFFGTEGTRLELLQGYSWLDRSTPDYSRLFYDRSGISENGVKTERYMATTGNLPPVSFSQEFSGKFFSRLQEHSYSPSLNFSHPFSIRKVKNIFKTGALFQSRNRDFDGRNFLYIKGNQALGVLYQGPDSLFRPENFAPDLLTLRETTQKSDFYRASTRLWAGYVMNETQFGKKGSRLIYGLRYESYYQNIEATEIGKKEVLNLATTVGDWLPSVNAIWNLNKSFGIRAAYSVTVNRPELRELAGFTFFDPNQNVYFYGNPTLTRARIRNLDLRGEWYPSSESVVSLSGFYKKFENPIEVTRGFVVTLPTFTYTNRDEATNYGVEAEVRFRLQNLDSALGTGFFSRFVLFGNLAVIRSQVFYAQTNFKRPIHGQSPYVLNSGIQYASAKGGWEGLFTWNRVGPRVAFLDDQNYNALIWENPRDVLDLSIGKTMGRWNFRLTGGDLLGQELVQYIVYDRGGRVSNRRGFFGWISNVPHYQKGQDIPYFRFTNGRTLRVSVTWKL